MTTLSAIVPTRDRPDLLRDCLATLVKQDVPAGLMEVVVVDDGSAADLSGVVSDLSTVAIPVRMERQEPSGLNVARNRGATAARGAILAYLDDDTLVAPEWAAAVIDAFEREGCDGLAGRIRLQLEAAAPRWLTPRVRCYLTELDLGPRPLDLDTGLVPFGANCATSRAAFERLGGFRVGLDREGSSLLSNGDIEFFGRLRAAGGRIRYRPDASVLHRVVAQRLTKTWFRRRVWAQGVGDGLLDPEGSTARDVLRAGRAAPILARNAAAGRGIFAAELWLRYCAGRIAGRKPRPSGAVLTPQRVRA